MPAETGSETATAADPAFVEEIKAFEGRAVGPAVPADDPVNTPMIRHWVEAMGDDNPVYLDDEAARATGRDGTVAPGVMLQVWIMKGLKAQGGRPEDEQGRLLDRLDQEGYTSVVATNTDQEYLRELVPGDHVSATAYIDSVSDEKTTALGTGFFVTTRTEFHDQDGELVGTMMFRILKYRPAAAPGDDASGADEDQERPPRPRPATNADNQFWFDGAADGKLLIQKCSACGELRHPPGPFCPQCRSLGWEAVEASGRGTVYSYVVNHHPPYAAFDYPLPIGLIELEEGTRLVAQLVDVDPDDVEVGMDVEVRFTRHDEDLVLPEFAPAGGPGSVRTGEPGSVPTGEPGSVPTGEPGSVPTGEPGSVPTGEPGSVPTGEPGSVPTGERA